MRVNLPITPNRRGSRITETENGFEITATLPGIDAEDLVLEIFEGVLTLKAERIVSGDAEPAHGKFLRRLMLPYDVPANDVDALFHSGVLTIHIPPPPNRGKPQKIPLRSAS